MSATTSSDSSIYLEWRNNDAAAAGIIALKKVAGAAAFATADSIKNALPPSRGCS